MLAVTRDELVTRMSVRIRDHINVTFTAEVLAEAVGVGIRRLFPAVFDQMVVDLGAHGPNAKTIDLTPAVTVAEDNLGEIYDLRYEAGGVTRSVRSWTRSGSSAYLRTGSKYSREYVALVLVPRFTEPASGGVEMGLTGSILEAAEAFALAWLFDGYHAGRLSYDKYTTATTDDVVAPFEIESAARVFRTEGEVILSRYGSEKPGINH